MAWNHVLESVSLCRIDVERDVLFLCGDKVAESQPLRMD
jgi:hypothetical protein